MGKKSSSSQPSQADPTSPITELPRMDPPPPYETVTRSSTSSSIRSTDHLDPDGARTSHELQTRTPAVEGSQNAPITAGSDGARSSVKVDRNTTDGGCMNMGKNTGGCMNVGDNVNGCMNYGDGSDGCMNYSSPDGCMNYKSTGGCMNYEVAGEWQDNEGCMNYRRGGGCCLFAE